VLQTLSRLTVQIDSNCVRTFRVSAFHVSAFHVSAWALRPLHSQLDAITTDQNNDDCRSSFFGLRARFAEGRAGDAASPDSMPAGCADRLTGSSKPG
jgi:hypothetical protein